MADDIDIACDLEQMFTEAAIEANRKPTTPLKYIGVCYNCESEIKNGAFCSKECGDEWEWFQKRKNGHETFVGAK